MPNLFKEVIEGIPEDLKKLNYTADLLLNNPDKKYRNNFWKYIDGKGYDRLDYNVSSFEEMSCISGLFSIFNSIKNFSIKFSEDKHCTLCGYLNSEDNVFRKSLLDISNEGLKLQNLVNIIAYKQMDFTSSCPECYKNNGIIMDICCSRLHDFIFHDFQVYGFK